MRLGLVEPLRADREEDVPLVAAFEASTSNEPEMLERGRREAGLLAQLTRGRLDGRLAVVDHAARELEGDPAHALLPLAHEHRPAAPE